MHITLRTVVTRYFDDTPVTVTDPCYRKGTWCTIQNIHVLPGDYDCIKGTIREYYNDPVTEKRRWGYRIAECGIYHKDYPNVAKLKQEHIGSIGVDAGLAGFFQNKPDYTDAEWYEFCNALKNKSELITEHGFCTTSGYGDGCYDVYTYRNDKNEIVGLKIRFI